MLEPTWASKLVAHVCNEIGLGFRRDFCDSFFLAKPQLFGFARTSICNIFDNCNGRDNFSAMPEHGSRAGADEAGVEAIWLVVHLLV